MGTDSLDKWQSRIDFDAQFSVELMRSVMRQIEVLEANRRTRTNTNESQESADYDSLMPLKPEEKKETRVSSLRPLSDVSGALDKSRSRA